MSAAAHDTALLISAASGVLGALVGGAISGWITWLLETERHRHDDSVRFHDRRVDLYASFAAIARRVCGTLLRRENFAEPQRAGEPTLREHLFAQLNKWDELRGKVAIIGSPKLRAKGDEIAAQFHPAAAADEGGQAVKGTYTMGRKEQVRVAIYARMSTDKQNADSPADQVAACRRFAAQRDWQVVEDLVVQDAGISGASRHNRPQLLQLVARIDEWDVLLAYDFSRLARDSEDLGWLRNRLKLHAKTAYEASTGLDIFNVGSKVLGILNEEYLVKLAADTHRGLRGRFERGMSAGGRPYGYDSVEVSGGRKLVPNPEQAAVVRRIYQLTLAGQSQRAIAYLLNEERVPAPRPRAAHRRAAAWAMSAVHTILENEIYKGELIWNRSRFVKDHETGVRKRFERPESEWLRRTEPELVIVEPELWNAVSEMRAKRGSRAGGGGDYTDRRGRQSRTRLLTGLLACGVCGHGFHTIDARTWGCGRRRDRGPHACTNTIRVREAELERRILHAVDATVLVPDSVAYLVGRVQALVEAELEAWANPAADKARLAEIEGEVLNLVRAAAKLGHLPQHDRVLAELEAEKREIEARLAAAPEPVDLAAVQADIEAAVSDLRGTLADGGAREVLQALLAGDRLRVMPDPERGFAVEGEVRLLAPVADDRVVAGTGFEPVTFGL